MEKSVKILLFGLLVFSLVTYRMKDSISKLIEQFEGFSAVPYNDPPGSNKYSIGYGHQIQPGESFTSIDRVEAAALLVSDTETARDAVDGLITAPLNSAQYAALVSFVYNVGSGAFANGTVPEKINSGDFQAAANTMRRYINAGGRVNAGLVARRDIEAASFDVA